LGRRTQPRKVDAPEYLTSLAPVVAQDELVLGEIEKKNPYSPREYSTETPRHQAGELREPPVEETANV
jgi:hypothetical protein